jgi:hypothetical protein
MTAFLEVSTRFIIGKTMKKQFLNELTAECAELMRLCEPVSVRWYSIGSVNLSNYCCVFPKFTPLLINNM